MITSNLLKFEQFEFFRNCFQPQYLWRKTHKTDESCCGAQEAIVNLQCASRKTMYVRSHDVPETKGARLMTAQTLSCLPPNRKVGYIL